MSEPQLYTSVRRREDGTEEIVGYAYGEDWIETALFMDDLIFKTPEEAKAWWDKHYGKGEENEGKSM